jgi:transcriptional regulator with XRE-family HTH domain
MTPADLAERARTLRVDARLTQRELADEVGYSPSTISKAENFHEGDGMVGARITIIETLTGEAVEGPLYR